MKVGEIMTRGVEIASPDDTVQQAASRMAELDVGVLPVGENDRLFGMLTDRFGVTWSASVSGAPSR